MHDVAPGQDVPPSDSRPARADKTRETNDQMSQADATVRAQNAPEIGETRRGPNDPTEARSSATGRGSRTKRTKATKPRPRVGGKGTKTKRKAGKAGGAVARKGVKQDKGGSRGTKGPAKAMKRPQKAGRKTTAKKPTKKRAGTGKASGKRNRR
ncbi:MAG TPA: hypothetical protein VFH78_03855 [Candidatus Thermoplasmatota archaeon]|nr:hypothetical protein [Candidatus Thermoplasmatota archaeon]